MKRFSFCSRPMLGLNIHTDKIECLEVLSAPSEKWRGVFYSKECAASRDARGLMAHDEMQAMLLKAWVSEHEWCDRAAAVSLPMMYVHLGKLRLPATLSDAEIKIELEWHLQREQRERSQPYAVDYVCLPFAELDQQEVYFAAADQAVITSYQHYFEAIGLKLKWIEPCSFSIARAIRVLCKSEFRMGSNVVICVMDESGWVVMAIDDKMVLQYEQGSDCSVDALPLSLTQSFENMMSIIPAKTFSRCLIFLPVEISGIAQSFIENNYAIQCVVMDENKMDVTDFSSSTVSLLSRLMLFGLAQLVAPIW